MLVNGGSRIARTILCLSLIFFVMVSNSWCAQEDYNGFYAGTYSGDDNGAWMIAIDINQGIKFFSYSTDRNQGDGGSAFIYVGEVGTIGTYTLALHKSSIFYYSLITLLSATHQENAGDLGVQPDWHSLSGSIHPEVW